MAFVPSITVLGRGIGLSCQIRPDRPLVEPETPAPGVPAGAGS